MNHLHFFLDWTVTPLRWGLSLLAILECTRDSKEKTVIDSPMRMCIIKIENGM